MALVIHVILVEDLLYVERSPPLNKFVDCKLVALFWAKMGVLRQSQIYPKSCKICTLNAPPSFQIMLCEYLAERLLSPPLCKVVQLNFPCVALVYLRDEFRGSLR